MTDKIDFIQDRITQSKFQLQKEFADTHQTPPHESNQKMVPSRYEVDSKMIKKDKN